MTIKEENAIVKRLATVIENVKRTIPEGIIESWFICPIVDVDSNDTVAIGVPLTLSMKHTYDGDFFDAMVRKLKAESYKISFEENEFKVTFRVEAGK